MVGYGGDIWSTGAFSFESPLKDLLDSGSYTVEQLLAEDELLQELRGCHTTLIEFLSTEESVTKLINFIITTKETASSSILHRPAPPQVIQPEPGTSSETTDDNNNNTSTDMNEGHVVITVESNSTNPNDSSFSSIVLVDEDTDKVLGDDTSTNRETHLLNGDRTKITLTTTATTTITTFNDETTTTSGTTPTKPKRMKEPGEWIREHILDVVDTNNSTNVNKHPEFDPELLYIRFPYMACEIICCEIPSILDTLVTGKVVDGTTANDVNNTIDDEEQTMPSTEIVTTSDSDDVEVISSLSTNNRGNNNNTTDSGTAEAPMTAGDDGNDPSSKTPLPPQKDYSNTILDYLFSVLVTTKQGELDDYRAGYLEKILNVLFRKKPDEITAYLNCNKSFGGNYYYCVPVSTDSAVDAGGASTDKSLMEALLKHLYSHSIMQIAQRLLLPPKPTGKVAGNDNGDGNNNNGTDGIAAGSGEYGGGNNTMADDNMVGDELIIAGGEDGDMNNADGTNRIECDWSNSSDALELLLDILIGDNSTIDDDEQKLDLSLNASEVLITIIQNSMLSSNTMLSLTQSDVVLRIIKAATELRGDFFSPHESMLTSAMNVLESLILQLGGYGAVGTMSLLHADPSNNNDNNPNGDGTSTSGMIDLSDPTNSHRRSNNNNTTNTGRIDLFRSDSEDDEHQQSQQHQSLEGQQQHSQDETTCMDDVDMDDDDKHIIADLGSILEHLPFMLDNLTNLLLHPSTKSWKSPMQYSSEDTEGEQLLGNSRLRIIRVLESLVLLGDPDVDVILVQQSSCLEICLNFFWQFQWCSMLHQSVANLLVHVFEGQNTRFDMQEFFLLKCNLLGRLMNSFVIPGVTTDTTSISDINKDYFANDDIENNAQISQQQQSTHNSANPTSAQTSSTVEEVESTPTVQGIIVENLNDLTEEVEPGKPTNLHMLHAALLECGDISGVVSSSAAASNSLPVSEDDVDVAMEGEESDDLNKSSDVNNSTNTTSEEQLSTEAVRFESRNGSFIEGLIGNDAIPLAQSFRYGYMGHVIIICQALVNAYMQDDNERQAVLANESQQGVQDGMSLPHQPQLSVEGTIVSNEDDVYDGPKDDFGDPLLLAQLVSQHPLAERWYDFVTTTLASENAIQSTPQGGYGLQNSTTMLLDPIHSHRPGLIDEGYMMGDDGEGPPAPPVRVGGMDGSTIDSRIDMDDNDLDIAASMMAGLVMNRPSKSSSRQTRGPVIHRVAHNDLASDDVDDSGSFGSGSADSEKSYNSGETANERTSYAFDDPLGKAGLLGIELGKLTQYDHSTSGSPAKPRGGRRSKNPKPEDQKVEEEADEIERVDTNSDDDGSHSSASSDDESSDKKELDVPVMDLFAGNFNFNPPDGLVSPVQEKHEPVFDDTEITDFADFANFDDAAVSLDSPNGAPEPSLFSGTSKPHTEDLDDDFGPFATNTHSDPTRKQSQEQQQFGNFEAFPIDDDQLDPFQTVEPVKSAEFEEIFGDTKGHLNLLEQDDEFALEPPANPASAEASPSNDATTQEVTSSYEIK